MYLTFCTCVMYRLKYVVRYSSLNLFKTSDAEQTYLFDYLVLWFLYICADITPNTDCTRILLFLWRSNEYLQQLPTAQPVVQYLSRSMSHFAGEAGTGSLKRTITTQELKQQVSLNILRRTPCETTKLFSLSLILLCLNVSFSICLLMFNACQINLHENVPATLSWCRNSIDHSVGNYCYPIAVKEKSVQWQSSETV